MKNVFRQDQVELTDEQKQEVKDIKQKAQELWDFVEQMVPSDERSERARLVNVGKTQLEIAVAMLVKGLTTPQV